jgi:hypothetical protein
MKSIKTKEQIMNKILMFVPVFLFCGLLIECSNPSSTPKQPEFRVYNEHSGKSNIQIKTTGGNTININGIDSGYVSAYQSAAEGQIDVTANSQGDTTTATAIFNAMNNNIYTIQIVNTNPVTLSIVSP